MSNFNSRLGKGSERVKISNEVYDVGKWVVWIFMPAFAVFIGGVGDLYGFFDPAVVVSTINLVAVFLGSVLQISSQNYHKNGGGDSNGPNCT